MQLKKFKTTSIIIGLTFIIWSMGFCGFLMYASNMSNDNTEFTDAIIVLTGGQMRVEEGFKLLGEHKAKKLLISGVGAGVVKQDFKSLFKQYNVDPLQVVLGSIANDTNANVLESKAFMHLHGYKTLRLVTANYHMLRSAFLFKNAMPEYIVILHPVKLFPIEEQPLRRWLIATKEYNKFIVTVFLYYWLLMLSFV